MRDQAVVDRVLKIIDQTPTHDPITDKQYRAYRFKKEIMARIENYRACLAVSKAERAQTVPSDAP